MTNFEGGPDRNLGYDSFLRLFAYRGTHAQRERERLYQPARRLAYRGAECAG